MFPVKHAQEIAPYQQFFSLVILAFLIVGSQAESDIAEQNNKNDAD